MTQLLRLTVNGENKTVNMGSNTVFEEVKRFYDVATILLDYEPTIESTILLEYGDKTFNGFVYSTTKTDDMMHSVVCRTNGAKLTEPYSPYTDGYDDATNSQELCDLYETESGLTITLTSEVIDFKGSYQRNGTMLSALSNIASVTGSDYYDNGSGIIIEPSKYITENGTEIPDEDIMDFVSVGRTVFNKGVGFVTIRNGGSETDDIISKNGIYAEIDECSGEIFVAPNPYAEIETASGVGGLTASVLTNRPETISVLDKDIIRLDCAIDSIISVTLNGDKITDYKYSQNHNIIYFNSLKRGTITVTYNALGYKGYCNVQSTTMGRFVTFDLFYLDQLLQFQGFLSNDCNTLIQTDGDMTCIVPDEMIYPKGFNVYTIGGSPALTLYNKNTIIFKPITSTSANYVATESGSLQEISDTVFRHTTRHPITANASAKSAGVDIDFTTYSVGDEHCFEFDRYYPSVEVSYETSATKHYIKFANIEHGDIALVIENANTGERCEYQLDGIDLSDLRLIPCELNQYVPVDVAGELSVEVTEVSGETLSYLKPDGTNGTVTVDRYGIASIYVFMDGRYILDTSDIKARTTVTLTSNVEG